MVKILSIIMVSSILLGINSYYGVCPNLIAMIIAIVLFFCYIEEFGSDYAHFKFSESYFVWLVCVISFCGAIVFFGLWTSDHVAWCKHPAIMMVVVCVDTYIGVVNYDGYYWCNVFLNKKGYSIPLYLY